jgi:hypothetical protein
MSMIEQMEMSNFYSTTLDQGTKVRIKYTGQVVELKRLSEHGISVVSLNSGADYFVSNKFLESLPVFH